MPAAQSADKTLRRARQASKAGNWAQAVALYQGVLARFPANTRARREVEALRPAGLPALLASAQAAQAAGSWAEAERDLSAAAVLAPEMLEVGLALAACRLEMGRAPAALRAAEAVLALAPTHPGALNARGRALREMGRGTEAEDSFKAALGDAATEAQSLNNLGILARGRGEREAAAGYFRRALALAPTNAALHRNLAQAITYDAETAHLGEMRARLAAAGPDDPGSAPLHFALFKALDDLDRRDEGFAHLEKANRLTRAARGYDFKTDALPYALTKAVFATPVPALDRPPEPGQPRAIFVTGLPRTGTTLTERILSRAPGTQACGELTVVQLAAGRLLRSVVERADKTLTAEDLAGMGAEIRAGLAEYSDGSPVLIDKMPLNFRWIGFLCATLPEARIVHLNRDPMATAWSIYRHDFAGAGHGFAYDPADIARFMVLHREAMAHWRRIYPDRVFELDYGDLVGDTERATRALAAAVGLTWTEDWLTPERAASQILTASAEQARRPIYRGSDAGWQRYAAQLGPLRAALTAAGVL